MIPGRQAISGFDPNSIPGLTLWMDAADANTITTFGTGRIGIWADKSSNRYGFSNYVTGPSYTQTQNGLNVVTFTASNATDPSGQCLFKFVGSLPMSLSSHAVFAVHKPDLTTGTNYGDNNLLVLRAGTDQLRFPATISGSAQYSNSAVGTAPLNDVSGAYNLSVANLTSETLTVSLNGTRQTSQLLAGLTTAVPISSPSNCLGAFPAPGSVVSNYYSGSVGEILVYSNGLSSNEQAQVEGYLAWKWGLRASLPSTHPYASNPPFTRPFLPIDVPDCLLWFDAADTRTLTTSGTQVTKWQNKGTLSSLSADSSAGTASTGFTFNTSSLNTVQFPAAAFLAISNVVTTNPGRTLFAVLTVTSYGNGASSFLQSSTSTGRRQVTTIGWNNGDTVTMGPGGTSQTLQASNQYPFIGIQGYGGLPYVFGLRHTASSASNSTALTNAITINGSNVTLLSNVPLSPGYFVGSDTFVLGTGAGNSNVQQIGEVLQYDRPLTDAEMRRIEGYLLTKWNVCNAASSHPYQSVPPSFPASFSPTLISGCRLWLDAADTTTVTATGSAVTSWRDKSGLGNTLTFAASATTGTTTQAGNNVLVFASSYGSNVVCRVDTANHTLFAVHRPTSTSTSTSLFRFQRATATPYVIFPFGTRGYVTSADGASLTTTGTGLSESSSTTTFTLISAAVASASLEVFSNGVFTAGSTASLTSADTSGIIVGATSTGGSFYDGQVGELIVYTAKLSAPQRQLVEGYLAKKWGL